MKNVMDKVMGKEVKQTEKITLQITEEQDEDEFDRILVRWGLGETVRKLKKEEVSRNIFVELDRPQLKEMGIKNKNVLNQINRLQEALLNTPTLGYVPHYQRSKPFANRLLANRYILAEMTAWGDANVIMASDFGPQGDDPQPSTVCIKMHSSLQAFRHEVHMYQNAPPELVAPLVDSIEAVEGLGHCLILEYSMPLSKYIANNRMNPNERKMAIEQILHMMQYFHTKGGVMCTLSPKILAEYEHRWKLINCEGMRKHMDFVPPVFDACYAPPELVQTLKGAKRKELGVQGKVFDTQAKATRRMDTWALGVTIFELFTQEPMFKNEAEAIAAMGGQGTVGSSDLHAIDDIQARNLVEECLRPKPKNRYKLQDIQGHAYLRGGLDEKEVLKHMGKVSTNFKTLQNQSRRLLGSHEERKLLVKRTLQQREADAIAAKLAAREVQEEADRAERMHGKNLWMNAIEEEEKLANRSETAKKMASIAGGIKDLTKVASLQKDEYDGVQWL